MSNKLRAAVVCLLAGGLGCGGARADVVFGLPIRITDNATVATATFSLAHATWTGMLYRDDGTAGLGQFLFNNRGARAGDTRVLGTFGAGDEVLFNYKVVVGAPGVFRMDVGADAAHFALEQLDSRTVVLRIEDQPMNFSDRDWDDCVAVIRFSKGVTLGGGGGGGGGEGVGEEAVTPAPGAALGLAGGLVAAWGRRRRA